MVLGADETERKGCDSPLGEPESLKQSDERSDRSRQEVAFVPAGLNYTLTIAQVLTVGQRKLTRT